MPDLPRRPAPARSPSRRTLLALAAALPAGAPTRPARADARLSQAPVLLVPGTEQGHLAQWGTRIAAALGPALPAGTAPHITHVGGEDGVTAANQFAARVAPDGNTLLLAPGAAALAWLMGDPRAKFDATRWLGVLAGTAPCVVCGRAPATGPVRVGLAGPVSPDLAALLGLELAGLPTTPVFGELGQGTAAQALAAGAVDAVLLRGAQVAANLGPLVQVGAAPMFTLGAAGGDGRDALLPQVPNLAEFAAARGAVPSASLVAAWRGIAAAAQTEFALVLPQLTPAALVAVWRHAAAQADLPDPLGRTRTSAGPEAQALAQALAPDPVAQKTLRGWLATRLNWAPG